MQLPPTSRAGALVRFPTASRLGRRLTLVLACCTPAVAQVPLQRWTNAAHPTGVAFGFGNGIAAGDFDGDGYVDVYQANSGNLWRNVSGTDWVLARNLASLMPPTSIRYSSSFADYDLDGRVDIAIEPRYTSAGDTCLRLLHNLDNAGGFAEVAGLPAIVAGQPCDVQSETICWGDVDGDGWLDFVLPTYPGPGPGNSFFHSLGPTGPGGAVRFQEMALTAGLQTTPWCNRPEGAELADVDRDGDLDFYANGTLYQNTSSAGLPRFSALQMAVSGIQHGSELDEGALLFDYDLDGDLDLLLNIADPSTTLLTVFENRGDSTFFEAEAGVFDQPTNTSTGLSAEDWDNDGDLDVTNYYLTRRNQFVETGARRLAVVANSIPELFGGQMATPCWIDWDHDGDMDCVLGKFLGNATFYENTLHGPNTPLAERRYVDVRPAKDGLAERGSEVEFGARVEVVVRNPPETIHRTRIVSSAGGYLNQSQYTLHFGLPAGVPIDDIVFDVVVDFPGVQTQGIQRVDAWVNPALGGIRLAALNDREITVLRSGRVIRNGVAVPPLPGRVTAMATSNQQLARPLATTLPLPVAAPADTWVGVAFDTQQAAGPLQTRELVVDGQLASATTLCGGAVGNIALLELRNGVPTGLVPGSAVTAAGSPRNARTFVPVAWRLQPGREYAAIARVVRQRASPAPADARDVQVHGALSFQAADPCTVPVLTADPTAARMWLRWSRELPGGFVEFGAGVVGSAGVPVLQGIGVPARGQTCALHADRVAPSALAFLVAGQAVLGLHVLGGVLLPSPEVVSGYLVSGAGTLDVPVAWPITVSAAYFQLVVLDAAAPFGVAASNAVLGQVQ